MVNPVDIVNMVIFAGGKISRKWKTDLTLQCYFHSTSAISIAVYWRFYFGVGVIKFLQESGHRKKRENYPHTKIFTFTVTQNRQLIMVGWYYIKSLSVCHWLYRVPTVLEKSLNFGFSLKSPWKWICPWKVLEYRGPSLKFQLVVLDFLFCVFLTKKLNGNSKLRGTRANFPPKIWLASLAAAYKFNIFPVPLAHI